MALCQLSVTADKARNIARARAAIESAAADGAKLVLLPVSAHERSSVITCSFSTNFLSALSKGGPLRIDC